MNGYHEAVIIYIAKNIYQKNYNHYSSKKNKKGEAFIREITKDIIKLGDEIGYSLKVKPTRIEELLRNHFKIHYNIFFRNQKLILNNITSGLPNENQISKMENEGVVDKNHRYDAVIKEANIAFEVNKIILENNITISRTCINIVLDEMYQNEKPSITMKYYECKELINSSEFNNEELELILRMIARKDPLEALLAKLEKINESQPKNI